MDSRRAQGSQDRAVESCREARKVLIADDNVDAALALALLLQSIGYEVHTAHDGREALEAARRLKPDAILLDIAMPIISGDEVCKALRRESWAETVLIAAITGYSAAQDRKLSEEAGFDHHLVKPVDPRTVRRLLQSL